MHRYLPTKKKNNNYDGTLLTIAFPRIYIYIFLPISDFSNEWTVRAIREAKIESRTSDTPNLLPEMISSPVVDKNPALKISYNRVYD